MAQELHCHISVNAMKLEGTNRMVFQTLQQALYEFMNNRSWTDHQYEEGERIECTMILTLNEQVGSDEYKGMLNVQLRRPVFNSSYHSPILNFVDNNLHFKYIENTPLEFTDGTHLDNLTSTLAFYAYIVLGYDYDTFGPLGGQRYFERAQEIVDRAQSAPERGWRAYEGDRKNRYWLANNLLSDKYRGFRRALYTYHRLGMDQLADKMTEGRGQVLRALEEIQRVHRSRPDPDMLVIQLFNESKREEIINLFSEAPSNEKARCSNIMVEVDKINASRYTQMVQSRSSNL